MTLVKCSECLKEINDKASQCMHCGALIEKQEVFTLPSPPNYKSQTTLDDFDKNLLRPNDKFIQISLILLGISYLTDIFYIIKQTNDTYTASFIIVFLSLIALICDRIYLVKKYSSRTLFSVFWLLITPAYLYKRAKYFGAQLKYFWIFLGLSIGGSALLIIVENTYNGFPSCENSEVIQSVTDIAQKQGHTVTDLKNIKEIAFYPNLPIRFCQGLLSTNKQNPIGIYYKLTWKDQDKGEFWVEIIEE